MLLTPRGLCGEACHPHTFSTNATQPLASIQGIGCRSSESHAAIAMTTGWS